MDENEEKVVINHIKSLSIDRQLNGGRRKVRDGKGERAQVTTNSVAQTEGEHAVQRAGMADIS